jgi:putative selenate reductase FAD-binding subunit
MIVDYLRPKSLDEAIKLLSRPSPQTIPMGGGTSIKQKAARQDFAVVDLQALKLDGITVGEDDIELGASAALNAIMQHSGIPEAVCQAIQLEGTANTRNQATLGGRLVTCEGRSALITTLLAVDAMTLWDQDRKEYSLGEWLALPNEKPGRLLLSIRFNKKINLILQVVNKTKLDLPLLCVAAARWPSGRIRMAVGGFGENPKMAFDGPTADVAEMAVENSCANSGDYRASESYRRAMAVVLTRRCLQGLQETM